MDLYAVTTACTLRKQARAQSENHSVPGFSLEARTGVRLAPRCFFKGRYLWSNTRTQSVHAISARAAGWGVWHKTIATLRAAIPQGSHPALGHPASTGELSAGIQVQVRD